MKKIIQITFLLFLTKSLCQTNLAVNFFRCQYNSESTHFWGGYNLLKNDTLYKSGDIDFIYEKLQPANYALVYKNIFEEEIVSKFTVEKTNDSYAELDINLCLDKLQDSRKSKLFFDSMKNGESILIRFSFAGCFNSGSDSIIITKEKDSYTLIYKNKKRKLKAIELIFITEYENELRHLKKASFISTLNAENEIVYGDEKYYYHEPSVYWGGFNLLKQKLNLK